MYFVFFILIICTYLIWNNKNHKVVIYIFSFVVGLIYATRSISVGNDTESYYLYYLTISNKYITNPLISFYEPIYHFIISNSPSFQFYLFVVSFLTVLMISLTFKSKSNWLRAFLLLYFFGFFNVATDQSRQLLSLSVLIYFIKKLNYSKNIFSGILASFVHKSNLLIAPFVMIFNYLDKKNKTIPNYIYIVLLFISLYLGINKVLQNLVSSLLGIYIPGSIYVAEKFYLSNGGNDGFGLMYYRFVLVIIFLTLFFFKKKSIGFNIVFSGLIIQISSLGFMPIERIGFSLFFLGLVIIVNDKTYLEFKKWKVYILYFYALIYFIQTNIMNIEKNGSVPWSF